MDDAAEGDDGDLGGASADVHDHRSGGLIDGESGAEGGGHGLFDDESLIRSGVASGLDDGALFDLGDATGDADHDGLPHDDFASDLVDEVAEHGLGLLEVGDDAVLEGAGGDDVGGGLAKHALGFFADGEDLVGVFIDGDDAGLADDDAFAAYVDEGVGGPEVNSDVATEVCVKALP